MLSYCKANGLFCVCPCTACQFNSRGYRGLILLTLELVYRLCHFYILPVYSGINGLPTDLKVPFLTVYICSVSTPALSVFE